MAQELTDGLGASKRRIPAIHALVILLTAGLLGGLTIGHCSTALMPKGSASRVLESRDSSPYRPVPQFSALERQENPTAIIPPPLPPVGPAKPPVRLKIPVIGVDAATEILPFLAVPSNPNNVGWFNNLPAPGENGDAVFDGHLDWTTGPAVFYRLSKVQVGDDIFVEGQTDTRLLHFKIDNIYSVSYLSTPPDWLYSHQGPPQLSLITCGGAWNARAGVYEQRLLVHSNLVSDGA